MNSAGIIYKSPKSTIQYIQRLIEYPEILKQIFDICFKPDKFADPTANKINNKVTYIAIEILSNMG